MTSVPTRDGRSLTVREAGDPDGVPVLAIAGTPGSTVFYEPHVRDAEERGVRLVSYARPGYEGSSPNPGRTIADCAADIAAVCDALDIERFCVWGASGGGPHALAAAALLRDRVAAAAAIASVAPYDGDGLDFLAGMGEQNVRDFRIAAEGGPPHRAGLEQQRRDVLAARPEELVEIWETLLGPSDRELVSSELATFMLEHLRAGIADGVDGWLEDEAAFVAPWGFEVASISAPVFVWQGAQDRMVPPDHGRWLADHIPGAEFRFTAEDGHLTLINRVPGIHAWLLERARLNGDA